eukprot:4259974-Pyramimonas_sp.AAC.1
MSPRGERRKLPACDMSKRDSGNRSCQLLDQLRAPHPRSQPRRANVHPKHRRERRARLER